MKREMWWPKGLSQNDKGYFVFSDEKIDRATFYECLGAIGRNDGPALLFDLHYGGTALKLDRPELLGVVADVWSAAEYPERLVEAALWRSLFNDNGYSHDGDAAERPAEAVTVYGGCHRDARFGMSWTTDLQMARRFAHDGLRGRERGDIYVATVQPRFLLSYIGETIGRGESEYVVEPRGLNDGNVVAHLIHAAGGDQ